jgi:protein-arginine kinase activator protein McsA
MIFCESCRQGQAYILYYESVAGKSRQIHLCQACAAEKGFNALPTASVPEVSGALSLGEQLARAISSEEFEEAARLRDLIKAAALGRPEVIHV